MPSIYIRPEQRRQVENLRRHNYDQREQLRKTMSKEAYKEYFGFLQPDVDYVDLPDSAQILDYAYVYPEPAFRGPILETAFMRKELYDEFHYWNPLREMPRNFQYFQNPAFEVTSVTGSESLLVKGIVVGLVLRPHDTFCGQNPEAFLELRVCVNEDSLLDPDSAPYHMMPMSFTQPPSTTVYLKIKDIQRAASKRIVLDIIRYELLDYNFPDPQPEL